MSRVLSKTPPEGAFRGNHLSRTYVAARLKQPTRIRTPPPRGKLTGIGRTTLPWRILFDLAPNGVYLAGHVTAPAGGLLHHPFTLTAANRGGLLSVALACGLPRVDVIHHPVLWSPDFPRSTCASRLPGRPVSPNPLYAHPKRGLFPQVPSQVHRSTQGRAGVRRHLRCTSTLATTLRLAGTLERC